MMLSNIEHGQLQHRSANACLCPLYSVDGMHVVTVEGEQWHWPAILSLAMICNRKWTPGGIQGEYRGKMYDGIWAVAICRSTGQKFADNLVKAVHPFLKRLGLRMNKDNKAIICLHIGIGT